MSQKPNKLELFINNYAYSINEEYGIQVFTQNTDEFGNKFFVRTLHWPAPDNRTYRTDSNQYEAMKTLLTKIVDLEHYARLHKSFED